MKNLLSAVAALSGLFNAANPVLAQDWTLTSAPYNDWRALASSADGTKLVAAAAHRGTLFTSTNSGATWTATRAPTNDWRAVASSADGTKLVALTFSGIDPVYTSTNSGVTWTSNNAPNFGLHRVSVASSSDGTKLVAVGASYSGSPGSGAIFTSTDSGMTWTKQLGASTAFAYEAVASSADGIKLVAVSHAYPGPIGAIYTSTDSGLTWLHTSAPTKQWGCVASSADGRTLVAGVGSKESPDTPQGEIYTSADSGTTWLMASAPLSAWHCLASSADGTKLVAVSGAIYTSTNSGATWAEQTSAPYAGWRSVASSADGTKLVAGNSASIYTWQTTPAPLLSIAPSGNNAVLSWTIPSMDFRLQQNSDLATTNWTDVMTPPVLNLTNLQNQVMVSPTNGNRFYRLKH